MGQHWLSTKAHDLCNTLLLVFKALNNVFQHYLADMLTSNMFIYLFYLFHAHNGIQYIII